MQTPRAPTSERPTGSSRISIRRPTIIVKPGTGVQATGQVTRG